MSKGKVQILIQVHILRRIFSMISIPYTSLRYECSFCNQISLFDSFLQNPIGFPTVYCFVRGILQCSRHPQVIVPFMPKNQSTVKLIHFWLRKKRVLACSCTNMCVECVYEHLAEACWMSLWDKSVVLISPQNWHKYTYRDWEEDEKDVCLSSVCVCVPCRLVPVDLGLCCQFAICFDVGAIWWSIELNKGHLPMLVSSMIRQPWKMHKINRIKIRDCIEYRIFIESRCP